jgi:hypothetical protein
MQKTRQSFNSNLSAFLAQNYPDVTFVPEPQYEEIEYPVVALHYQTWEKSREHLDQAEWTVQVDVVFKDHQTAACDALSIDILRNYNLTVDIPGQQSRIPKADYSENDIGAVYDYSDIRIRLTEHLQVVPEPQRPELRHNTFTLKLIHKDD